MFFKHSSRCDRPLIIAGPCLAESADLLKKVAEPLCRLAEELSFDFVFKASFDKANRSSIDGYRGPGLDQALKWFQELKKNFAVPVLTDVHETSHVKTVAEVCDVLQIPAFLCRQTDLIATAAATGRAVNVKKGQFLAPENTAQIIAKLRQAAPKDSADVDFALTERGVSFGYGNLVVDMCGLKTMSDLGAPVIFDITHSLQRPQVSTSERGATTRGMRQNAGVLARAASASGYLSGFFLEVHPDPKAAKSDSETQLTIDQASTLLHQIIPLWREARNLASADGIFS